ncbi:MAG: tRNA (adenosine(37)-N6)-dimethylallyltransferase MiaA [Deltaproteobacteria bacterium]|nr:tRNA (adenosine(37)-N6)-dimethylallyltransferase MiaA [Deltaproteobacteria bacterium]
MIDPASLPPCVFLAGPTASGKTTLAVELALRLGAEVVSADSMLVYRHLDVGTAKPTREQMRGVVHHLIDVVDPDEQYDAARFRDEALEVLSALASRRVPAVVAGGTGLYLRALRSGLAEAPPADPEYRALLERRAAEEGTDVLHAELASVDPETAEVVHPNDLVRIQRALEIHRMTGRRASDVRREHGFRPSGLRVLYIVLDIPGETLRERIRTRAKAMVEAGLVDEVSRVMELGYGPDLRPLAALNYRHAVAHLRGEYDLEGMLERMENETWQFSRRQRRWFRSEEGVLHVEPDADAVLPLIEEHLERRPV